MTARTRSGGEQEPEPPRPRSLWPVKWVQLIPQVIVLVFLWLPDLGVSLCAFAILATARYPRALFQSTSGVLLRSWRVRLYDQGALSTDRYPPFTLGDVREYPARPHVDDPERRSRGLVLVK